MLTAVGCIDIDECDQARDPCGEHGDCKNEPGSFDCACDDGFEHRGDAGCIDIDECKIDNGGCERTCTNAEGSFSCGCPDGAYLRPDGESCWNWHASPTPFVTNEDGDAHNAHVAVNPQGTAIAVWSQSSSMRTAVWSSRKTGDAWASPVAIAGAKPYESSVDPQVTVDDTGNAVALWDGDGETVRNTLTVSLMHDGRWGAPQVLSGVEGAGVYGPVLAGDAHGGALVVWGVAGHGTVLLRGWMLSGDDWTMSGELLAPASSVPALSNVEAAMDRNGDAAVLWSQTDMMGSTLWVREFDHTGASWGDPMRVDLGAAGDYVHDAEPNNSAKLVASANRWLVLWKSASGATQSLWANAYFGTYWGGATKIRELSPNATLSQLQVESDSAGNACAIWLETDAVRTSVWSSRLDAGVGFTWLPATTIESVMTGDADSPAIALEANGSAVAVWSHVAQHSDIWANRFFRGAWGTAMRIEDAPADATHPSVALDENGNALAVWEQANGDRIGVFSNQFD